MRKLLSLAGVIAFGLAGLAAQTTTPATKKPVPKKSSASASVHKAGTTTRTAAAHTTAPSRSASSRRGKRSTTRRTASTWRNRQLTPTADRYREIQGALAAKGYLTPEQANGKWDDASAEALRKFQAAQNLDGNGKINSLSLIALGLGPRRETVSVSKAATPASAPPAPATAAPEAAPSVNP